MKKFFALFATFAMLCAVGCDEQGGDDVNPNNNPNEQPDDKPNEDIPENIFFALDKESASIGPDGGSVDVVVYSNYKWKISGASDWCSPSVTSGEANEDGQKVTFSADIAYDDREATFWFRCADEKIKFTLSQKLKEVIIPNENNTFNIPAEGGVVEIAYQTTVECEVVIPQNAQSWISITPETKALVSEKATLTVAENTTYSDREAVVKVVKVGDNTLFAEYTISQVQNDAIIAENNTLNVGGWQQNATIQYQTNVECEVVIPDDCKEWISVVPETRALSRNSVTLDFADNNTGAERKGVVQVVAVNNKELVAEYSVTQNQRYIMEYTSNDGNTIRPYNLSGVGANRYENGGGYIDFNKPITSIGDNAFKSCTSLTSVAIPDSVTSIGTNAFAGCSSLTEFKGKFTSEDGRCLIIDGVLNSFAPAGLTDYTIPDSVTEIGDSAFYGCSSLTSITIPDSVTSIGGNAFFDCTGELILNCNRLGLFGGKFTKLVIGDGVTEIGDYAFRGCSSLASVTIPDSVTSIGGSAFDGCSSLTSVTIPDSVTSIGKYAFYDCTSLTSITIPDSVTSIGERAFYNCSSLTSITIPDSVTSIGNYTFYGCSSLASVTIPDSVTEIGDDAFCCCSSLASITIPDSVISIGNYAFAYCSSLTSVTIPDSVTSIGNYTFYGCSSLASVTIPDGVTSIGDYAFEDCSSLTSITIPDSVTSIGEWAFSGCTGELIINSKIVETDYTDNNYPSHYGWLRGAQFTSLTIGDSVTSIGERAFYECSSLTSVTIPDSVTSIGYSAFYECSSLTSVTIGDSVTEIGWCAFCSCSSLTSVTIPDSVTEIGGWAFDNCSSLTSVTIGDSVTEIGWCAFCSCSSLTSVYCKPTTPPSGGGSMFSNNANGRKLYVPTASVDAYKAADYWSDYADYIEGYDF